MLHVVNECGFRFTTRTCACLRVSIDVSLTYTELTDAMLLTEFGSRRKEEVFRPKIETIFKLAVEPNPVCGLVNSRCNKGTRRFNQNSDEAIADLNAPFSMDSTSGRVYSAL